MNKRELVKIIDEVVSDFDFLGNDANQKEVDNANALKNEDLQKQFICDSLLNKNTKIKIEILDDIVTGDYEEGPEESNNINVEHNIKIHYTFDQFKEPITFELTFDGESVPISVDSDYDKGTWAGTMPDSTAPSGGDWISSINWGYIAVKMWLDGSEIPFVAFEKAPERIQNLFIREYCKDAIGNNIPVKEKRPDNVRSIPYC
jgi:hypothetical protein